MTGYKKKVCVITACGNKKHDDPLPARMLYKSPRITAAYNRKRGLDMYILSAEHGLLPSEKVIGPYDRVMDPERMRELLPDMIPVLQEYDEVIFFKAGARKLYADCMEEACNKAGKPLDSFGFGFMGDIGKLEEKIKDACGS